MTFIAGVSPDIDPTPPGLAASGVLVSPAIFRRGLLRQQVRPTDSPCRYGGEEFVIVMRDVTLDLAAERIDALRSMPPRPPAGAGCAGRRCLRRRLAADAVIPAATPPDRGRNPAQDQRRRAAGPRHASSASMAASINAAVDGSGTAVTAPS